MQEESVSWNPEHLSLIIGSSYIYTLGPAVVEHMDLLFGPAESYSSSNDIIFIIITVKMGGQ